MKLGTKLTTALGAVFASAAVHAAPIVIDNFTTIQVLSDSLGGGASTSSVAGGGILGGVRDLSLDVTTDPVTQGAGFNVNGGGTMSFISGSGTVANGIVQWDGTAGFAGGGPNGINQTGFNIDLTGSGANIGFGILTYNADTNFQFEIVAYSGSGNSSAVRLQAHQTPGFQNPPLPSLIPFAGFAACGFSGGDVVSVNCTGTGVNFAALTALELRIFGVSDLDLTIGTISSVPEPSVLALIGASLFGIGFARRRAAGKAA